MCFLLPERTAFVVNVSGKRYEWWVRAQKRLERAHSRVLGPNRTQHIPYTGSILLLIVSYLVVITIHSTVQYNSVIQLTVVV